MTIIGGSWLSRPITVLLALLLSLGVLVTLGSSESATAAKPSLRASSASVVVGEKTVISGKLAKGKRPIQLQTAVGKKWVTVQSKATSKKGAFAFKVKVKKSAKYRAYAPKARTAKAITTKVVRVTVVQQAGSAHTLPGVAAYGSTPAAADAAQKVVASRFLPARPGRPVVLQTLTGGAWTTLRSSAQNTLGSASFKLNTIPTSPLRAVAVAHNGAPAMTAAVVKRNWEIDYESEFSGTALPPEFLHRLEGVYPGGLRTCARGSRDMVKVGGGVVELLAKRDLLPQKSSTVCPHGTYRNAHIGTTYDTYKFGYGVAAARVKFQEGGGQHAAFWLQSQSGGEGAEIDVAEFFGKGRSDFGLTQFIHYLKNGVGKTSGSITDKAYQTRTRQALGAPGDDWWKAYHVFSVEWSPSGYVFRIDGTETFRTSEGLSSREAVVILSALTSDYEIPRFSGTDAQNTTSVDWLRVWQE